MYRREGTPVVQRRACLRLGNSELGQRPRAAARTARLHREGDGAALSQRLPRRWALGGREEVCDRLRGRHVTSKYLDVSGHASARMGETDGVSICRHPSSSASGEPSDVLGLATCDGPRRSSVGLVVVLVAALSTALRWRMASCETAPPGLARRTPTALGSQAVFSRSTVNEHADGRHRCLRAGVADRRVVRERGVDRRGPQLDLALFASRRTASWCTGLKPAALAGHPGLVLASEIEQQRRSATTASAGPTHPARAGVHLRRLLRARPHRLPLAGDLAIDHLRQRRPGPLLGRRAEPPGRHRRRRGRCDGRHRDEDEVRVLRRLSGVHRRDGHHDPDPRLPARHLRAHRRRLLHVLPCNAPARSGC